VAILPVAQPPGNTFVRLGWGPDCMRWVAPSEKDTATATLAKRLWDAADQFRANSGLKAQAFAGSIPGIN
jgi:hypothetical protein